MKILFKIILLSVYTISSAYPEDSTRKLKIGVILPLTGGVSAWGKSVRQGIELANEDYKERTEIFFEDEATCNAKQALTAYKVLTLVNKVDIVIGACLEGGRAVAPLARQAKIPFFVAGRSSKEFQKMNSNSLTWISLLDFEGDEIAKLIKKKGWRKGSIMVWGEYFGLQFMTGIEKAIKKNNLNFSLKTFEVPPSSNPVGAEVQRLILNKPDVIFLMLADPAAAYVLNMLKVFNYTGDIVIQSSMLQTDDPAVRKDFVGAIQQKFEFNSDQFLKLRNIIKNKLGDEVVDDFVFSYDGFSVLLKEAFRCFKLESKFDINCINGKIRNEEWRDGASGKFRYMKNGSTERPMVFKVSTKTSYKDL